MNETHHSGGLKMTFLMPEVIETDRLLLRQFQEADWKMLGEILSDPEAVRYTIKTPFSDWQTWRFLATYLGHWQIRGFGPYAVVEKSSGHMIGPVGLWYPGDWPEPEIKYTLNRHFWGKGYASEAALAVKNEAVKHLDRKTLISLILPENEASKATSRKIGGAYEKTIPFRDGQAEIFRYRW
jgi:RimJ/RimL family protein N-acetyltransferase